MSRIGFRILHAFWWLFSPTYRTNTQAVHTAAQHLATYGTTATLVGGQQLVNVHPHALCQGHPCAIHNPTNHHMRSWPQHWRQDRYLMERHCAHGIGHPDPDHIHSIRRANPQHEFTQGVHGCDGCCKPPNTRPDETGRPAKQ